MVSIWYSLVFIGFNIVFHMFFIWFSFVFMGVHVVFIWFSFVFIGFHVVFGFHILQNRFQDTNSMPAHFAVPSATFTSVALNALTQGCLGQCNNFMVTAQERSKEGPYGAIPFHMVFNCFHVFSIGFHMWFSYQIWYLILNDNIHEPYPYCNVEWSERVSSIWIPSNSNNIRITFSLHFK